MRQSSEAAALFVSSGGMRAIVCVQFSRYFLVEIKSRILCETIPCSVLLVAIRCILVLKVSFFRVLS